MKHRWADEDIVEWAKAFILGFTMIELQELLEVPHSTLSWCFINRLPHIDIDLYQKIAPVIHIHRQNAGRKARV